MHITCHGDFINDEYYLYFENSSEGMIGVSDKIKLDRLEQVLQEYMTENQEQQIQLAFISACYSEKISDLFLNCGIPVVIGIKQNHQVLDKVAC